MEIIRELIKNGANINATNENGETPLYKSAFWAGMNIILTLIELGANVDAKDINGNTPLHIAIAKGEYILNNLI